MPFILLTKFLKLFYLTLYADVGQHKRAWLFKAFDDFKPNAVLMTSHKGERCLQLCYFVCLWHFESFPVKLDSGCEMSPWGRSIARCDDNIMVLLQFEGLIIIIFIPTAKLS